MFFPFLNCHTWKTNISENSTLHYSLSDLKSYQSQKMNNDRGRKSYADTNINKII